jgi:hypothetical protein
MGLEPRIWVVFSESCLAGGFWIWFWFHHCTYLLGSHSIICIFILFHLVCFIFSFNIFMWQIVIIDGVWVGNRIYWTLKQLMTTLYKSLSHTDWCSPSWSSLCCLVVAFSGVVSSASMSSLADTIQLQLPIYTNWFPTSELTMHNSLLV